MARFAALFVLCLVVTPTTQAQSGAVRVSVKDCTSASIAFIAKCFKITTKPAAAVSVNLGTDKKNMVSTPDRSRSIHTVLVRGLSPDTMYYGTVTVTKKNRKLQTMRLPAFRTAAPGSVPAQLSVRKKKLLLNEMPILYYTAYLANCPDQEAIGAYRSIGFKIVTGFTCVPPGDMSYIPTLGDWLGSTWWHQALKGRESQAEGLTSLLRGDVSFSSGGVFPGLDPCANGGARLSSWFSNVMENIEAATKRSPAVSTLWVSSTLRDGTPNCLTARWMSLYFWGSLAKGASGSSFDTHQPIHAQEVPSVTVDNDIKNEITRELKWAASFGPVAVTGRPAGLKANTEPNVIYQAWKYGSSWYIVVVNPGAASTFRLAFPVFVASTAQGMWGTRSVKMNGRQLQVNLAAESYGVYRVMQAKK